MLQVSPRGSGPAHSTLLPSAWKQQKSIGDDPLFCNSFCRRQGHGMRYFFPDNFRISGNNISITMHPHSALGGGRASGLGQIRERTG
jgi:hypothetical protein